MAANTAEVEEDAPKIDEEIIPGNKNVVAYCSKALRSLLLATKASNELPNAGDDFDYYSSFDGFRDVMDIEAKRILGTLQSVMRYHGLKGNVLRNQDATELEDKFDLLVDANDQILERVGAFLDEAAGLKKQESTLVIATVTPKQISGSWNKKTSNKGVLGNYRLLSAKNIMRPQLKFKEKVDNTYRPFIPLIKEKYNALRPLPESLLLTQKDDIKTIVDIEKDLDFPHPYQYELDHLVHPESLLKKVSPQKPKSLDTTPLSHIYDMEALNKMLDKLKREKEIAVDLEHHSYRTFQGLTCLMQISTRTEDFIIDTLSLRSDLFILNQVFTDPNIVKVIHGADKDIEWLQRDLGLYVVNMFDTGQAARVLRLARFSLAHLLWTYCEVQADKQYQLADWRIRPLPQELVQYAREDTHYLLYIYDCLRNELLEKSNLNMNLLRSVLTRSTQLCAKKYVKPVFTSDKYMMMYQQSKKIFNAKQLHALKALYAWRDKVAREEDESEGYVLPNHMLLQIAELLPKERQGILACCNPIPPILRQSMPEVYAIVMEAREVAINEVVKPKVTTPVRPSRHDHPKYRENNPLYTSHDLSHQEKRLDLPHFGVPASDLVAEESGLFQKHWTGKVAPVTVAVKPHVSAFFTDVSVDTTLSKHMQKSLEIEQSFASPFAMFLPKAVMAESSLARPHPGSMVNMWRLKANTAKPKPVQVHQPEAKVENKAKIGKAEEEKGILSLNQILEEDPPVKKIKKDIKLNRVKTPKASSSVEQIQKPVTAQASDNTERKRKKEKLTADDVQKEGSHDYSKADFAIFAASSAKKSKKEKNKDKKKDYNPATVEISSSDHKNASKPRLNPLTGQKSQTFGQSREQPQTSWPKR